MPAKVIFRLLKESCVRWWTHNTFQLGAALAYYTVFSMAPIILIAVSIGGMVFGEEAARRQVARELRDLAGPQMAKAFEDTTQFYHQDKGANWLATAAGIVVMLIGASSVFAQLQQSLNFVWGVEPKPGRGIWGAIKDRFLSFALVLGIGFLLLVSLVISAFLSALAGWFEPQNMAGTLLLWRILNVVVSLGLVTLLFAMIYRILPDMDIPWSNVWVGALVTALLFTLGKTLIGLYLGQSGVVSAYGAAASVVIVLMWVYYSSQILLLGAEFTYVYSSYRGQPLTPSENAEPATEESRARRRDEALAGHAH